MRAATCQIQQGLAELRRARRGGATLGRGEAARALNMLTEGQMQIESSKIDVLCAATERTLRSHDKAKVVVAVNYTRTLETLAQRLASWEPLVLNGATPSEQRERHKAAFQAPDTRRRLLLGNVRVIGCGIDLDDQHGDYPRLGLLVPNYETIMLYQFMGRFDRALTRSRAKMLVVYTTSGLEGRSGGESHEASISDPLSEIGEHEEELLSIQVSDLECSEASLIRALCRKGEVMASTMCAEEAEGRKLPGQAVTWVMK